MSTYTKRRIPNSTPITGQHFRFKAKNTHTLAAYEVTSGGVRVAVIARIVYHANEQVWVVGETNNSYFDTRSFPTLSSAFAAVEERCCRELAGV